MALVNLFQESLEDLEELDREGIFCKSDGNYQAEHRLKRQRSESPTSNKRARPVPPLQSILGQTSLTSHSSSQNHGAGDCSFEMQTEHALRSSPPNTLAKLLTQSPVNTLGSSQSCSLEAESSNIESSKNGDNSSLSCQMVRLYEIIFYIHL
jgi:hypothetical protein